ncbi:hypothetical protein HZC07_04130 [Candidatus Micrarchaeota archaeon]|nr:hypothetical protein [Candidatus Micrarchaeota archaeon]
MKKHAATYTRMMILSFTLTLLLLLGCTNLNPNLNSIEKQNDDRTTEVGSWRVYSAVTYFDSGGGGGLRNSSFGGEKLSINSDGTWQFGASSGTWTTSSVSTEDWNKWGVDSYGPTKKMIIYNWNGEEVDGPIEETDGRIDFIWMIYRIKGSSTGENGQVQIKYGRA